MRTIKDIVLTFPAKGINVVVPRTGQPEGTTIGCQNVRLFDTVEGRGRGGSRPGLSKYCPEIFTTNKRIQDINYVTTVINSAPSSSTLGIRTIKAAAVCNGAITKFNTAATTAATVNGARTLSSTAPFIFSTELFGRLYYADGISYKTWVPSNNVAIDWTPTAGTLPGTDGTIAARLIEMWRSRIVLAGLRTDPHNWFMSSLGDPLDWDYAPNTVTETQAVQGGVGVTGKIGDIINCMIPYSDDILLFGCDHSIWQMSGDPQAGGRLDLLSDKVGISFGRPWCRDDEGNLYFFSTRAHLYKMPVGGGALQDLTQDSVAPLKETTNLNYRLPRLVWDREQGGIHLFLTPIAQ